VSNKRIEIIITSILVVMFALGAIRVVSMVIKSRVKKGPAPVPKKAGVSKVTYEERLTRIDAKTEQIGWERNPFVRGKISEPTGVISLNLSGIIWDEQNPNAIIGDTVVKEGDVIGKYKVIKINKNSVILSGEEGEKILSIWGEE